MESEDCFAASLADDIDVDPVDVMAQTLSDSHGEVAFEKPPMEMEIACLLIVFHSFMALFLCVAQNFAVNTEFTVS